MTSIKSSINNEIQKIIQDFVNEFIDKISNDNITEKDKLKIEWNRISQKQEEFPVDASIQLKIVNSNSLSSSLDDDKIKIKKATEPKILKKVCEYKLTKGAHAGEFCSGTAVSETKFCKKHSKSPEVQKVSKVKKQISPSITADTLRTKTDDTKIFKSQKAIDQFESGKKIIQDIQKMTECIKLKKNKFGNFYHPSTGFLIDPKNNEAYGKQSDDSDDIIGLTAEDIDNCKKLNFKYRMPPTLIHEDGTTHDKTAETNLDDNLDEPTHMLEDLEIDMEDDDEDD